MASHADASEFSPYSTNGSRKYLNHDERQRVLAAMAELPPDVDPTKAVMVTLAVQRIETDFKPRRLLYENIKPLIDCICQIDFIWLASKIWKQLAARNFQKIWMV